MPPEVSAHSVLALAVQLEEQGAAYYRRAAELPLEPATCELLRSLADMEDDHRGRFEAMRSALSPTVAPAAASAESTEFLRTFSAAIPFEQNPAAALGPETSPDLILRQAISAERDSIALYVALKELIPDPSGQDEVMKIIREEMGHATLLTEQLVGLVRGDA
jgi:rubrerythrin